MRKEKILETVQWPTFDPWRRGRDRVDVCSWTCSPCAAIQVAMADRTEYKWRKGPVVVPPFCGSGREEPSHDPECPIAAQLHVIIKTIISNYPHNYYYHLKRKEKKWKLSCCCCCCWLILSGKRFKFNNSYSAVGLLWSGKNKNEKKTMDGEVEKTMKELMPSPVLGCHKTFFFFFFLLKK